jgi:hypothetical protein
MKRFLCLAAIGLFSVARAGAQQAPTLTLVEELRIDGNDHEWSRVDAIHVAKNGTIYVRHPGDAAISMFNAKGELIKQFARTGDGPGEVRAPSASGIVGDSLYITEQGARRVSLYGLDGTPGRVIRPVGAGDWIKTYPKAGDYTSHVFIPTRLLPNNVAIGGGLIDQRRLSTGLSKSIALFRMSWDGIANGVVAEKPFGAFLLLVDVPGLGGASTRQPFAADPVSVFSPSGQYALASAEEQPSPAIVITYFSLNGDTLRRARVPYRPRPVTSKMVDSVLPELAKAMRRQGHEDLIRKQLTVPKYLWPIGQATLADDGRTWIQLKSTAPEAQWLVVSPQGTLAGIVTLPRSTEILLVQDAIWAVVKDDDDVPSLVKYRLK